jgi:hypothetical protein
MIRARTPEGDRGESLIELVLALALLGVAVVAIVMAAGAGAQMSDIHRKEATASASVRDFAAKINNAIAATPTGYVNCATTTTANYLTYVPPAGYSAKITGVKYWTTGNSWVSSCSTDIGIQKLSIAVSSTDGRASEALDVIVRKPCRITDTVCT